MTLFYIISSMADLTLQELRSLGGKATVKKYGKDYMSYLGKRSAEKRKKMKAEAKLPLDNG